MADDKPEEGKGPSQALATTPKADGPAVRPVEDDDGAEEILALVRREADHPVFANFRNLVTRRHLTLFGGSVVALDLALRVILNSWWGLTLYLPLTISTIIAFVLYKVTRKSIAWWYGRGEDSTVFWKVMGDAQVKAFARRRILTLCAFASEVGQSELTDSIQKLNEGFLSVMEARRELKRRVARVGRRMKPYGSGVPLPEPLRAQAIALEMSLLGAELLIQNILSGLDIIEAELANLLNSEQDASVVKQEIDRLLAEIDRHGKVLHGNEKDDALAKSLNIEPAQNAPDKK